MSTGLKLPLQVDSNGRTARVTGDEQADKIIRLALADNDNNNAFQQNIGLGTEMVFNINNPGMRARVISRLFKIFSNFEKLDKFKLYRSSIRWTTLVKGSGETNLEFRYINLETDKVIDFAHDFGARGTP